MAEGRGRAEGLFARSVDGWVVRWDEWGVLEEG